MLAAIGVIAGCTAAGFAQSSATAKTSGDDAKIYAEVKAAIEKHEKVIDGTYEPTAEEARESLRAAADGLSVLTGQKTDTNKPPATAPVNQFDQIIAKCDLLIKHDPNVPDYYRLRGKARYFKDNSAGIFMFTELYSLAESKFAAFFPSADIAAGIKDFSDSLSINPAAKLDDTDAANAHLFRGKLYAISASKSYSKQNLQNALLDFDEARKLDGWDPPSPALLKCVSVLSKDVDLVGQDFALQLKEDPTAASQIYLDRAAYLSIIVDYNKVLADLMRYASLPAASKAIIRLKYATLNTYAGDAYQRSNISTAQEYLEKAQLEAQFPDKQEAAFNDATAAQKLNPGLVSAYVIRAKYLVGSGKVDEGMAEAYQALMKEPDNVGALCIRGLGLAIKNNIACLDDFNKAIAIDPELAALYNAFGNRAKVYTALGKTELAAVDMQKGAQLAQTLAEIRK